MESVVLLHYYEAKTLMFRFTKYVQCIIAPHRKKSLCRDKKIER